MLTSSISVTMEVVCNWMRKGERLFQSGRSYLAASVYQKALKKLEDLNNNHYSDFEDSWIIFQGHWIVDMMKKFAFKIEACLADANLKSRDYSGVITWTYPNLTIDDGISSLTSSLTYRCHASCNHSYAGGFPESLAEEQKHNYIRIHYCRAMALYHLYDTKAAIEHMEEAHTLDPGDGHVFEYLTMLKQKLADEVFYRRQWLNKLQIKLQKKQSRRRSKACGQGFGVSVIDGNK